MQNLKYVKDKLLKLLSEEKTVLFVGVGNRIKSDDAIGVYICKKIIPTNFKKVLIVESGIEKFVGKINTIAPDILALIDCTDFNKEPGYWNLVPIEKILDHTMHTHTISIKRISEFFEMPAYILGVQPKNVKFGEVFSEEVLDSANNLIQLINKI